MKRFVLLIFTCVWMGGLPLIAFSHGIDLSVEERESIVVTALYNDGTPMNYAETEVYAPDAEILFCSGFTDRNGRFCIFPDVSGEYRVVIQDGMGHRAEKVVAANQGGIKAEAQAAPGLHNHATLKVEKIIVGLSAIFLISGGLFWYRGRKNS